MESEIKRIYNSETLLKMVNNKHSCIVKKRMVRRIELKPKHLGKIKAGIVEALDSGINKYDYSLDGILLDYGGLTVVTDGHSGRIIGRSGNFIVSVAADFFIFQPNVGSLLEGEVHVKKKTHIACLVHKIFNAVIPKPEDLDDENWNCSTVGIGNSVVMKIVDHVFSSHVPHIVGKLLDKFMGNQQVNSPTRSRQFNLSLHPSQQEDSQSNKEKICNEARKLNFDLEEEDSTEFVSIHKNKIKVDNLEKKSKKLKSKEKDDNVMNFNSTMNLDDTPLNVKSKRKMKKNKEDDGARDDSFTQMEKVIESSSVPLETKIKKKKKREKEKLERSEDGDKRGEKDISTKTIVDSIANFGDHNFSFNQEAVHRTDTVDDFPDNNFTSPLTNTIQNIFVEKHDETDKFKSTNKPSSLTKRKKEESFTGEFPDESPPTKKNCRNRNFNSSEVSLFTDPEDSNSERENTQEERRKTEQNRSESAKNRSVLDMYITSPKCMQKSPRKSKENAQVKKNSEEIENLWLDDENIFLPKTQKNPIDSKQKKDLTYYVRQSLEKTQDPVTPTPEKMQRNTGKSKKREKGEFPSKKRKSDEREAQEGSSLKEMKSPSEMKTQKILTKAGKNENLSFDKKQSDSVTFSDEVNPSPAKSDRIMGKSEMEKEVSETMTQSCNEFRDGSVTPVLTQKSPKKSRKKDAIGFNEKSSETLPSPVKKPNSGKSDKTEKVGLSKKISLDEIDISKIENMEKSNKKKKKEECSPIAKELWTSSAFEKLQSNGRLSDLPEPIMHSTVLQSGQESDRVKKSSTKSKKSGKAKSSDITSSTKKEKSSKKRKSKEMEDDEERLLMIDALLQHVKNTLGVGGRQSKEKLKRRGND